MAARRHHLLIALIPVLAGLLAGCGAGPTPLATVPPPLFGSVRDSEIELTMRVERSRYRANEPIGAAATLTYIGPKDRETLVGSGTGLVLFAIEQLDGPLDGGGAASADCVPRTFERAVPVSFPFAKSGGFTAEDPNAVLWKAWYEDPLLRLPPGRWRLHAIAELTLATCGGERHAVATSVDVDVEP